MDYKEAAENLYELSTEEIVADLATNKECDKRLKDIARNYKKLNAVVDKFDNYEELEDKFIELDNLAEDIIIELAEESE